MSKEVKLGDKNYPILLKSIPNPPKSLFIKGLVSKAMFNNCLAVVGSRKCTPYGLRVVKDIVGSLARRGLTIVSGFMYGIDIAAHLAAIETGGKTIAVMPCGIENICPPGNYSHYERLLESGSLVVSEYPGDLAARKWTFRERNRIVAGLSLGTLVIEGGLNSGSLLTATYTQDFNRHLFSIPGNIYSATSKGTNSLFSKGAHAVGSAQDVLNILFPNSEDLPKDPHFPKAKVEHNLRIVLDALDIESLTIDQLSATTSMSKKLLSVYLFELEVAGLVKSKGGYYIAC